MLLWRTATVGSEFVGYLRTCSLLVISKDTNDDSTDPQSTQKVSRFCICVPTKTLIKSAIYLHSLIGVVLSRTRGDMVLKLIRGLYGLKDAEKLGSSI